MTAITVSVVTPSFNQAPFLKATIRSVFGEQMPLFVTAGNHDVWSDSSEATFETVLGHPVNFSFEIGDARLILFDTGPILGQAETPIEPHDTTGSQTQRLAHIGARLLIEALPAWLRGESTPQPQDEAAATYGRPNSRLLYERDDLIIRWIKLRTYHPCVASVDN